jgi:hypothetical protein
MENTEQSELGRKEKGVELLNIIHGPGKDERDTVNFDAIDQLDELMQEAIAEEDFDFISYFLGRMEQYMPKTLDGIIELLKEGKFDDQWEILSTIAEHGRVMTLDNIDLEGLAEDKLKRLKEKLNNK